MSISSNEIAFLLLFLLVLDIGTTQGLPIESYERSYDSSGQWSAVQCSHVLSYHTSITSSVECSCGFALAGKTLIGGIQTLAAHNGQRAGVS